MIKFTHYIAFSVLLISCSSSKNVELNDTSNIPKTNSEQHSITSIQPKNSINGKVLKSSNKKAIDISKTQPLKSKAKK